MRIVFMGKVIAAIQCALYGAMGSNLALAQVDEGQMGAWYIYTFDAHPPNKQWGVRGDIQHRNWDIDGDLEQLLIRGGVSFRPESLPGTYTVGVAHITSGQFGASDATSTEYRAYQEADFGYRLGSRLRLGHRLRYEQRWVDGQDFRTRYRYMLSATLPINAVEMRSGTWYASAYNELFINGERHIGRGVRVDAFDRNRLYAALGYVVSGRTQIRLGYMHQHTDNIDKGQLQFSLHHRF